MSESALSLQHGIMLHQQQQIQRHLFDTVVSLSHFSILLLTQFLIRFCKGGRKNAEIDPGSFSPSWVLPEVGTVLLSLCFLALRCVLSF